MPRLQAQEQGFALLALLGVIGAASLAIVLAVQTTQPPLADHQARVVTSLATIERATREAFQRTGSFPADLSALAASGALPRDGLWRIDPFGNGSDYDYQSTTSGPRIRSRGPDRRLGTADDVAITVTAENQLRVRTNPRLRLIRALYTEDLVAAMAAASANQGSPAPVTAAALRTAIHRSANHRRAWLYADAGTRSTLAAELATDAATIESAQTFAAWTLPAALTGAGGLMQHLGLPDRAAVDGQGRALQGDSTLGVTADGNDRTHGTDDDS